MFYFDLTFFMLSGISILFSGKGNFLTWGCFILNFILVLRDLAH